MISNYADVILPLPLANYYTYNIPDEFIENIKVGSRVVVPFGNRRVLTAIVAHIHSSKPMVYATKPLLTLLDEEPTINKIQMVFFHWMSSYYMCKLGEVIQAAIPSGLKISTESRIQLNPERPFPTELDDIEQNIVNEIVLRDSITYQEAEKILNTKTYLAIKSLLKKRVVLTFEEFKQKYSPRIEKRIKLNALYENKTELERLLNQLENIPKKQDAILGYLLLDPFYTDPQVKNKGVLKSKLLQKGIKPTLLKKLIEENVFEEHAIVVSRLEEFEATDTFYNSSLSLIQQEAFESVTNKFETFDNVLLHGITGSGKTHIYVKFIKTILEHGSQVLFLVPEIALTTQIVSKLKTVFGKDLGVYHSKYSDNERVEVWQGVKEGTIKVVIGVRSSIFLPFQNIGLIIIDEEHEASYKQNEPNPKYNAREAAIYLAKLHFAKVLLGTATPSVETYYNTEIGKWGIVQLQHRHGDVSLPDIKLIPIKEVKDNKGTRTEISDSLLEALRDSLSKKEQSIVFHNRRGYAPYIQCELCNFIPSCFQCDVTLTFHLYKKELICHYCGHHEKVPSICPACGSFKIKTVGFGTEKLEENLQILIPEARIQRMDLDNTRGKNAFQKIISDFENHQADILVGTQIVTKGLDFNKVNLVGVIDIDRMLYFPDFRSQERVFQLLIQVSGRSGRKESGKVLIQTVNTNNPIFSKVQANDYIGFYKEEIKEREKYNYPPFSRIISLKLMCKIRNTVEICAKNISDQLKIEIGTPQILGPEYPPIEKIKDYYIQQIIVKLNKDRINIIKAKEKIQGVINNLQQNPLYKSVLFDTDVDSM